VYHPTNLPDCPSLNTFNELIRLLLGFGLEQARTGPEEEIKESFIRHFADNGFSEAGAWFWRKRETIKGPLLELLSLPLSDKRGILAAFTADLDLAGRFADGRLQTPDLPLSPAVTLVGTIAANCYTDILAQDGVPAMVLGATAPLDRQTVLRAFLDAQNQRQDGNGRRSPLKVCPGCDGRPASICDGKIHEDLDHFFPKSRYPLLAVHLLNLTPFCKDCNQSHKKSKDAIMDNDARVAAVRDLQDIYHPYLRPAQPDVEVQVRRLDDGQPHIVVEPRQNEAQQLARLQSLLYTLNVNGRWDGDLIEERLRPKLEMLLDYGWQAERDQGSLEMNEEKLCEALATAVAILNRFIGREPGSVAALAHARWLIEDRQGLGEWVRVMETAVLSRSG
jgi:hypothetical protein